MRVTHHYTKSRDSAEKRITYSIFASFYATVRDGVENCAFGEKRLFGVLYLFCCGRVLNWTTISERPLCQNHLNLVVLFYIEVPKNASMAEENNRIYRLIQKSDSRYA